VGDESWEDRLEGGQPNDEILNTNWEDRLEGGDPSDKKPMSGPKLVGQALTGGVIESAPIMPLVMGMAKAGSKFGWPGTIAGAAGGLAVATYGGSKMRELAADAGLTYGGLEDLHPNDRPTGRYFEILGSAIGGGVSFAGTAKTAMSFGTSSAVGRFTNKSLQFAKNNPWKFTYGELVVGNMGGMAAGIADRSGGGEGTILAAEVAGGMISPRMWGQYAVNKVKTLVPDVLTRMGKNSREAYTANLLMKSLQNGGEDPALIMELLRAYDPAVSVNAADVTGSETLGAIQHLFAKESESFGADVAKQYSDSMDVMMASIGMLKRTGHPDALAAAAEIEMDAGKKILEEIAQRAELQAAQIAQSTIGGGVTRANIGRRIATVLDDSLGLARGYQSELWNAIPDVPANVDNFKESLQHVLTEVTPSRKGQVIPSWVEQAAGDYAMKGSSTGELRTFRSDLLDAARAADKADQRNSARILGDLAEAVLEDMSSVDALDGNHAYEIARTYSLEFNNVFHRSFVGEAMSQGKFGARVPPELLVKKITASGSEAMSMRMDEIDRATNFMVTNGPAASTSDIATVMEAEAQIMQDVTRKYFKFKDGKLIADVDGLANFLKDPDTDALMQERFPDLREMLVDSMDSEMGRVAATARLKGTDALTETQRLFGEMMPGEPQAVVFKALSSSNPGVTMKPLINLVKKSNSDAAKAGLKVTVLDVLMSKATNPGTGKLDFEMFEKLMFGQVGEWSEPIMPAMMQNGVFTQDDIDHIQYYLKQSKKAIAARNPATAIEEFDDSLGIIANTAIRMTGIASASVITKATGGGGGHSLFIMGAASRGAQELLENMPNAKIKKIAMSAMLDVKYMNKIMNATEDATQFAASKQQTFSWLLQNGYIPLDAVSERLDDDQYNDQ